MKREYIIPLTGCIREPLPAVTVLHSRNLPEPIPCKECGQCPDESERIEQLGRDFAELLYCHVDGRFWSGIRKYIQEKENAQV